MSDAFFIFTTTAIGKTEFAAFLKKAGGVLHPDDPERGRVSQGRSHVWIFLSHDGLNPSSRIRGFFGSAPIADQWVGRKGLHYSRW
jgi:hypothetical protein